MCFSGFSEARQCFQRKKDSIAANLNSCHVNEWAIEAAGCTLITMMGVLFTLIFPLVAWLDKDGKSPASGIKGDRGNTQANLQGFTSPIFFI